MSVGPIGLLALAPFYVLWLGAVGLYWFFVFLVRGVVVLAPLVWSVLVFGWAHMRARSGGPASS